MNDHGHPPADPLRTDVPHSARVWNYLLGGKDNYPADAEAGEMILRTFPDIAGIARDQRAFLARAVRFLAGEAGIRQFLDIGTGLPTADNTHEVAQRTAPDSRIVYVDNDPLVLTHARALLTSTPEGACAYVDADVRDTGRIIEEASRTLDLGRPVGLTLLGIMGQLPDDEDPWALVDRLVEALVPGSYVALADGTDTSVTMNRAIEAYNAHAPSPYHLRSPDRIAAFLDGLEPVEPGVVRTADWRPDPGRSGRAAPPSPAVSGVARKP
ncbi:SAM-dependent methyltransferase [Streptomyces sp. QL37]|uniref:SAM-dependent methyltransferase n=1 Tax=Streptomyces sp. QL37 TaxID=2093747 RepID=UPI000CF2E8E1|nr:SAM-dependent methyltransferase [Streptomyces sp. QL37]PPQ55369.1 S-adenosyl methyltransferase [Streptomyces sp. QL37]